MEYLMLFFVIIYSIIATKIYLKNKLSMFVILFFLSFSISYSFPLKYDLYFKRYSKIYFPYLDWRWFKSQGYQESLLNPKAKSYVGAVGIMQIMPKTAEWLGLDPDKRTIPELSIHYGIKYDKIIEKQWNRWSNNKLEYMNKIDFIFASYNSGSGHILKAWKMSNRVNDWNKVKLYLPKITGKHSKETITYVERINKWFVCMFMGYEVCR